MLKKYNITVNGKTYDVEVEEVGVVSSQNRPKQTTQPTIAPKVVQNNPVKQATGGAINAPMPGTITDVRVKVGQSVKTGDVLLILEAMKMENEIMAPNDGVVANIHVSKGASVSSSDALITLE
jgi:biotin carboxyl carrier protein